MFETTYAKPEGFSNYYQMLDVVLLSTNTVVLFISKLSSSCLKQRKSAFKREKNAIYAPICTRFNGTK